MSTASQLPTIHGSRMTSLLLDYAELTKLHAHRNDRLVRIFFCVTEGWGALAELRTGACIAGNWTLAARRFRRSVADGGRFVVPRGLRKSTDWLAYVFDIGGISWRIYASETVFVSLF